MKRRGHRQYSPWLWSGILAVLVAFAAGTSWWLEQSMDPFRAVEKLRPADYYENANSLHGNIYQVEGVILGSLGWKQNKGRLFSISIREQNQEWPVPLWVPFEFQSLNIQKGQKYRAKVHVDNSGLLCVEQLIKS